jgi:hypothetical protein
MDLGTARWYTLWNWKILLCAIPTVIDVYVDIEGLWPPDPQFIERTEFVSTVAIL